MTILNRPTKHHLPTRPFSSLWSEETLSRPILYEITAGRSMTRGSSVVGLGPGGGAKPRREIESVEWTKTTWANNLHAKKTMTPKSFGAFKELENGRKEV